MRYIPGFLRSAIIAFVLFFACAMESQAQTPWAAMTQAQRNQAIVAEANSWTTGSHGGQCKVWVQNVVWAASGSTVWLPLNADNCSWNYSGHVVGRCGLIDGVSPGEIIQMQLSSAYGSGPHTLIVTANNGSSITIRESNWCKLNCELVGPPRTLTYQEFYNMVGCYSIYYVQ